MHIHNAKAIEIVKAEVSKQERVLCCSLKDAVEVTCKDRVITVELLGGISAVYDLPAMQRAAQMRSQIAAMVPMYKVEWVY